MMRRNIFWFLALGTLMMAAARRVEAQAPTIGTEVPQQTTGAPGSTSSMLGPIPGSGGGSYASPAVGGGQILGGRAGTAAPRVPTSISNPGTANQFLPPSVPALPAAPPLTQVPLYGTLELPAGTEDGPPDGLTFEAAIEWLIRDNLDLKARAYEIPSAAADVLTASLRGNPIIYADSQLIPYGAYTTNRQGGPAQYDLNVSQPIDYARKRTARIASAMKAKKAVELQYQDAVRIQIGNLATAYLDVVASRENLRYAESGLAGLDRVLNATSRLKNAGNRTSSDVASLQAQKLTAEIGVMAAREALRKSKLILGGYLNLPPEQAEALEVRDTLRNLTPLPMSESQLFQMALTCRPDVRAYQVGIEVAQEVFRLQQRNRFADAYLLYQPYTYQNLRYLGRDASATSWAIGITIPLPVFNRNQGNIERARLNIDQSKLQLQSVQRLAVEQVRDAEREYSITKEILEKFEQNVLPLSKKSMSDAEQLFVTGETTDVIPYLTTQQKYNDQIRLYRDTAVRHRRAMLGLNTVVGSRILP